MTSQDNERTFIRDTGIFTVVEGKVRHPRNVDEVVEKAKSLRDEIDAKLEEAYNTRKLIREAQNERINERFKATTLQLEQGDWVSFSKANTVLERQKPKLIWVGPVQVVSPVTTHAYKVRDLPGSERDIHVSRLWPYAGKIFVSSDAIRKQFMVD